MSATALRSPRMARRTTLRVAGLEQAQVAAGQLASGVGNLVFALVCAHILAPRDYSRLAAFLAAYLLLYMPFSSLAAGGALAPSDVHRRRRRGFVIGIGIGALLLIMAAAGLGGDLGLGTPLLLLLAGAAPAAGLLALERGRALGSGGQVTAILSLLSEPAVRLLIGVIAAVGLGASGAAMAVVLGGYTGLLVAARRSRQRPTTKAETRAQPSATNAVTLAFLFLAVLQNQDVLWANAQLGGSQAARFAVLSTLGGIAAFASTTVPLVLLPRARRREPGALTAAVTAAVVLGGGALLPILIAGPSLIGAVFGARYAAVAPLAVPYLSAMALLGVSRVIVAHHCAMRPSRTVLILLGLCAAVQALLIAVLGHDAASVADATLTASALLTLGLGVLSAGPSLALLGSRSRRAAVGTAMANALVAGHDGVGRVRHRDRDRVSEDVGRRRPAAVPDSTVARPDSPPAAGRARERGLTPARLAVPRFALPARIAAMSAAGRAVAGLTVGGLVLRLLAGRSLWLDEATSISQANMSFGQMWNTLRNTDVQPPLHDTLLWLINHVIGDSELAMRSPSLICGAALIPVVYLIGRDLWDRRTGLVAAILTTLAPFAIWYSQEARMYAIYLLLVSLALWAQVRILRHDETASTRRWNWWALYTLSTAALAWTQYFGSLFSVVQQAAFVFAIVTQRERRRDLLIPWLASLGVILVLVAPLMPFMGHQFAVNQAAGRGIGGIGGTPSQNGTDLEAGHRLPTVYAVLTNLVWGVWGYHSTSTMAALTALWPFGILLALTLLGRGRSRRTALLVALAAFPIAALFLVGQLKPFLFEIRYFCGGVPIALLLIGRMCAKWPGRRMIGTIALTSVFAASFGVAFADQQFSQTNPRLYDFQGALARITTHMHRGDKLLYAPYFLNDLVGYYEPQIQSGPLGAYPARTDPHGHVWIMASFQNDPANKKFVHGAISDMLRSGRAEIRYFTRPQVQVWEFR